MTVFPLIAVLLAGFAQDEGPVLPEPIEVGSWMTEKAFAFDWTGRNVDGAEFSGAIGSAILRYRLPSGTAIEWTLYTYDPPVSAVGTLRVPFAAAFRDPVGNVVPPGDYLVDVSLRPFGFGPRENSRDSPYSKPLLIRVVPPPADPPPDPDPPPQPERPAAATALRIESSEAP